MCFFIQIVRFNLQVQGPSQGFIDSDVLTWLMPVVSSARTETAKTKKKDKK